MEIGVRDEGGEGDEGDEGDEGGEGDEGDEGDEVGPLEPPQDAGPQMQAHNIPHATMTHTNK
jgi:hypothetical protein